MLELPRTLRSAIARRGSGLTILVLRLGAMGDIVRTLPAVRLVRAALPDARIHWVAWEAWTVLLSGHADLDGAIGLPRDLFRAAARLRSVRATAPDLVMDFHGDLRTGLIGRLSGAGARLGYEGHQAREGNRLFNTLRVASGERRTPRLERNLDLVRALGLPDAPIPDAGLPMGREHEARAASIAREAGAGSAGFAVINPGASRRQAYKKPPAALFGAAAMALGTHDIVPIVTHGPGEEGDAAAVTAAAGGRVVSAPATDLLTLAALLSRARLFVGGDSGPLHLACGVGCPVVGLYGPTDPHVNTPWRVPFEIVAPPGRVYTGIKSKDRVSGGFDGITEQAVTDAVRALLARPRS